MATDIESPKYREIVVTNIDWLFDFGIKESLTLHDTDTVHYNAVDRTIDIVLAPRDANSFPEYITYHIGKIIGQHTQQARLKVAVPDRAWRQPRAATASDPARAVRVARMTGGSASADTGSLSDRPRHSPRVPRGPQAPAPRNRPMYDSRDQHAVPEHTSGSWRGRHPSMEQA